MQFTSLARERRSRRDDILASQRGRSRAGIPAAPAGGGSLPRLAACKRGATTEGMPAPERREDVDRRRTARCAREELRRVDLDLIVVEHWSVPQIRLSLR